MVRSVVAAGAASLFATVALAQAQPQPPDEPATVAQPTFEPSSSSGVGNSGLPGTGPDSLEACGPAAEPLAGFESMAEAATGNTARQDEEKTPDFSRMDDVRCAAGALPEDQSAITAKVQTLLDRANVSPGVIDGWWGGMTETAIRDFEMREGLPVDGQMDGDVWAALAGVMDEPVTQRYTIAEEDADVVGPIPEDYSEKAEYERLAYQRTTEKIAEKFHMDEEFLRQLNPGAGFQPGETITVMAPGQPADATVTDIRIEKASQRLYAMDDTGRVVASYPVTIGSQETPSPSGTIEVTSITPDPWYNYDPETFVQGDNHQKLSLPPGPNNPVGVVWIALDKPGYGIHGTPEPSRLFVGASHGCVRMTNWDAEALAEMVEEGTTVEFVE